MEKSLVPILKSTTSETIKSLDFQEAYLQTALVLLKSLDFQIRKNLAAIKIVPSNSALYEAKDFQSVISKVLNGNSAIIRCGKSGNLGEIQICFDLNFKPTACKGKTQFIQGCKGNKIRFPKSI